MPATMEIRSEPDGSSQQSQGRIDEANETCEAFVRNELLISTSENGSISDFLHRELACPTIQCLYPHMHWVATRDGHHIDALHHNLVKGRTIVATEDPELHLIWYKKTIWVKPLPRCLLSKTFWETHLAESTTDDGQSASRSNAIGFMRSYACLIQHESDFLLAQECRLLPKDKEDINYLQLRRLLMPFQHELDDAVALRYHYGQIRLTRLNWALRLFQPSVLREKGYLGRFYYHQLYWSTTDFVNVYIAPFFFTFATLSVILSAMQVGLAVETVRATAFERVSWGFSVLILVVIIIILMLLVVIVLWNFAAQIMLGSWRQRKPPKRLGELAAETRAE